MRVEYYHLLLVSIIPIIYIFNTWLYVIQLKEYRLDRFLEYLNTKQGKGAFYNFWFLIAFPLFLSTFTMLIDINFEIFIYNMFFYFFLIYHIFVFGKLFRRKIKTPKLTSRMLLTIVLLILGLIGDFLYLEYGGNSIIIYTYLISIMLFAPLFLFFIIFLTLPIVNYIKNKKINRAINKSKEIDNQIKIAITGSYGKSSVKELLSTFLKVSEKTLCTPKNINTELGVSDIIIKKLNKSFKYFVAELGAYKIGEIDILGKIVNHKIGFLTAIGNQHLGLFGSEQNIITAKSEIQNNLINNNGVLYINWNNKYIRNIKFHNNINIVKYGNYEGVNARYNIIKSDNTSTLFNFCYKLNNELYTTNLVGEHNIINLTGVLACLYDLGFSTILIKKHIGKLLLPDNTLNITTMKSNIIIDDSYNLSYESLFSGLEVLKKYDKKQILILDDILELGKKGKEIHYEIGKKIASEYNNIRILYCGVNYKQDFIEGLTSSGFLQKNILSNIDIPIKNTVILFEGRKSYNFISKTKKLCR